MDKENENYCKTCGAELNEEIEYCTQCGTKKEKNDSFIQSLKDYIGKNSGYYLKKWKLNEAGEPTKKISLNWAGFFLTFFWAGYRKMYGTILLIFAIFLGIDIIMYLTDTLSFQANNNIGLVVSVVFLLNGNTLYYEKAKKQIKKHNQTDIEKANDELINTGGTSKLGVLFALLIFVLYFVISVFVIDPIFGNSPEVEFGTDSSEELIEDATE